MENTLYLGENQKLLNFKPVTYIVNNYGCWIINSHALDKDGYGGLKRTINGVVYRKAHRVSYAYHKKEIGKGMSVLHSCHNPSCINPEHLSEGTHTDNMQDRLRNGKYYEKYQGSTKLSKEAVFEIDTLLKSGKTQKEVSKNTGINEHTIADINRGRTWNHVTGRLKYCPKTSRKEEID